MQSKTLADGKVEVTFVWSPEHGSCYDCGLPAAYAMPERYGLPADSTVRPEDKLCSVCFASAVVDNKGVGTYLFRTGEDGQ